MSLWTALPLTFTFIPPQWNPPIHDQGYQNRTRSSFRTTHHITKAQTLILFVFFTWLSFLAPIPLRDCLFLGTLNTTISQSSNSESPVLLKMWSHLLNQNGGGVCILNKLPRLIVEVWEHYIFSSQWPYPPYGFNGHLVISCAYHSPPDQPTGTTDAQCLTFHKTHSSLRVH